MKYILTENELQALKNAAKERQIKDKKQLQDFCTKVANEMPVKFWSRETAQPWGCMLTRDVEWYCDECPAQKICPHEDKHWSK